MRRCVVSEEMGDRLGISYRTRAEIKIMELTSELKKARELLEKAGESIHIGLQEMSYWKGRCGVEQEEFGSLNKNTMEAAKREIRAFLGEEKKP